MTQTRVIRMQSPLLTGGLREASRGEGIKHLKHSTAAGSAHLIPPLEELGGGQSNILRCQLDLCGHKHLRKLVSKNK